MTAMRANTLWLSAVVLALSMGCVPPAETDVSGTVQGQDFTAVTGTAEGSAESGYSITLADDHSYDCTSTPVGEYLTVAVGDILSEGTVDAEGNVSFNVVDAAMQDSESATEGTVTIDVIEEEEAEESGDSDEPAGTAEPGDDGEEARPMIEGSMEASGPDSDVSGTFAIPICG